MKRNKLILLTWTVVIPLGILSAVLAYFWCDKPLSLWVEQEKCPSDIHKILCLTEGFGHGFGVLIILLLMYLLDEQNWRKIPRVFLAAVLAGGCAAFVKLIVHRTRPRVFDFSQDISESFQGWFPFLTEGNSGQGFPSGHATTAFALAMVLSRIYPQARFVFFLLAAFTALQRVVSSAHFLSDVIAGAVLATIVYRSCFDFGFLPDRLEKFETAHVPRRVSEPSNPRISETSNGLERTKSAPRE